MSAIVGYSRDIVRLFPRLRSGRGLRNVFEEVEPDVFAMDTDDHGACVFTYRRHGRMYCCLHTVALALHLEVGLLKPSACVLWPLAAADDGSVISVHPDALDFPCNTAKSGPRGEVDGALTHAIGVVFGADVRLAVEQAAREGRTIIELSRPSVRQERGPF